MFYRLHTPLDKIIRLLSLLVSGMGVNAVCRTLKKLFFTMLMPIYSLK